MKYYKLISANGSSRFAVEQEEGHLADLTSVDENLSGLEVIARAASLSGVSIDQIAERIIASGQPQILKMEEVLDEKAICDWLVPSTLRKCGVPARPITKT